MEAERQPLDGAAADAVSLPVEAEPQPRRRTLMQRLEDMAPSVFLWPSVLLILLMSIFPLFASLYLSFARVSLVPGGYEVNFIGWQNYERLFQGSQRRNFLGRWDGDASFFGLPGMPGFIGWVALVGLTAFLGYMLYNHAARKGYAPAGLVVRMTALGAAAALMWGLTNWAVAEEGLLAETWFGGQYWLLMAAPMLLVTVCGLWVGVFSMVLRLFVAVGLMAFAWVVAITLTAEGLPGTMVVTLIFVFGGVAAQYCLGLGLALLATQNLPGKRFFRIVFLLPMLITPVGVGFLFRMMSDTLQGPFAPLWQAAGLGSFSWVDNANSARLAIMITDTWQWTPFMFIILLAALEGVSQEPIEAALVDGANRWQVFRFIVLPAVIPVSVTLILIRMIEAFKIIDLPRIMTRGGPGTATESMTLYAFNQWKASASSIGFASAVAYLLLIIVTFFALILVNIVRRRVVEAFA